MLTPNQFNSSSGSRSDRTHIISLIIIIIIYHIEDLKWQNRLKVGTDKPKLKVKMQSVSDDDVRKRLLEKPRFELAVKSVLRLGRCYVLRQGVSGLWTSNCEVYNACECWCGMCALCTTVSRT